MCGILGWMTTSKSRISADKYRKGIEKMFLLSETRGKEASGVCVVTDNGISVIKAPVRAKRLIHSEEYNTCLRKVAENHKRLVMGHARMVTNGDASNQHNNQPIVKNDLMCIHNGIIVNAEQLWDNLPFCERTSEVDTEILLALLEKYEYQKNLFQAFVSTLNDIEGSLSIALVDRKSDWLFLYTNIGSLYCAISDDYSDIVFSSERYILEKMMRVSDIMKDHRILSVKSGTGYIINLLNGKIGKYNDGEKRIVKQGKKNRKVHQISLKIEVEMPHSYVKTYDRNEIASLMHVNADKIYSLRRCKKCLLPETFPGIVYDNEGVCSLCREYKKIEPKGRNAFIRDLSKVSSYKSNYDCIAPISGGRDSCYILHYLVKNLHLKPVAYTYDWGLVTDIARRNIQRMCASLGVEHILISADIKKKRENVRKNVEAWLKKPTLGTVPLFMAGDKQFFYYAQLLKKQMKVDNVIFGMNQLEETKFKTRFIGAENQKGTDDSFQYFSTKNKIRLFGSYGKEFIENPAFINSSLFDSFSGYLSYYAIPQKYYRFFDYIPWDQKIIEKTLIEQYNWETSEYMKETWRIGDGTAPFYNYIYYRIAGFTEFDTFRSNQIREGMLTREKALATLFQANEPFVEGFLWYCRTIGLDPIRTIRRINEQKPLYDR